MTPGTDHARTISSQVSVGVDPVTAFTAFTEEMDLWWVRGPINFYHAARAAGVRCEPGVGGRLLELYSDDAADALVRGRITEWRPGELLAWDSAVDDVETEVRFEAVAGGTRVTVTATIPAGGVDQGGTSWVRVVPQWFGAWCQRRDTVPHAPADTNRFGLAVYYAKPPEAARWLAEVFGFTLVTELGGEDPEHSWIEFRVGNCSLMLFPLDGTRPGADAVTHVPWVFVDDLDAHFEHAREHGATIVSGITQHGYRGYEAADLDGNHWTFAQARPTMPA